MTAQHAPDDTATESGVIGVLRVPGRADSLRLIRALVREAALARDSGPDWAHDLVLAVDEACQNVVRHGYRNGAMDGDIVVAVAADAGGLCVRISDTAPTVDPANLPKRALDEVRPGGLGVYLMRSLTDECRWEPAENGVGNTVHLRKTFASAAADKDEGEGKEQHTSQGEDGS